MKRTVSLGIAGLLLLTGGLVFAKGQADAPAAAGKYGTPGVFPLQKTLTISYGIGDLPFDPNKNPLVQKVEKETNVRIKWFPIESDEKRNIIFASDDYPDVCGSTGRWQALISSLLAEGVVVDLRKYLAKGYTPNLDGIFKNFPDSYAYMLNPAGQLPALPHFRMLEATFLEQAYVVNRGWLDKLGLKKPTTTEELKQVLIAFRDRDPNGNGKRDEIPLTYSGTTSQLWERAFYGIFGAPIKEPFVIENGKVTFAGMHPGFKDFVNYFADLYAAGLIDREAPTQSSPAMLAKIDNPAGSLVGWAPVLLTSFFGVEKQYPNRSAFEPMSPPQVPGGPKPTMWINPGYLAVKNMWFMTDKNPEPELSMAWVDLWYTLERTVQWIYGPIGTGVKMVNGKYAVIDHPEDPEWLNKNKWPQGEGPGIMTNDDFMSRFVLDPMRQAQVDIYSKYYKGYIAKEQWNRPELSAAETEASAKLQTDIWKLWNESQARWITGAGNVNAEWDDYVKRLKAMGVERYVAIAQAGQDRYTAAMKR